MKEKDFKIILLSLLKSMDLSLKHLETPQRRAVEVDMPEQDSIFIPEHIYEEICELIDSEYIGFMAIS